MKNIAKRLLLAGKLAAIVAVQWGRSLIFRDAKSPFRKGAR